MTIAVRPGCEPYSFVGGAFGVLILHGFTGNPVSMRPLAEACAREGFSVELPRLPGHGTTIEEMMTTNWADWSATALAAYDELAGRCDRVAVVGLSMGGGLAALVAESRPHVVGCVFINPWINPLNPELLDGLSQLIDAGLQWLKRPGVAKAPGKFKKTRISGHGVDIHHDFQHAAVFLAEHDLKLLIVQVFSNRQSPAGHAYKNLPSVFIAGKVISVAQSGEHLMLNIPRHSTFG